MRKAMITTAFWLVALQAPAGASARFIDGYPLFRVGSADRLASRSEPDRFRIARNDGSGGHSGGGSNGGPGSGTSSGNAGGGGARGSDDRGRTSSSVQHPEPGDDRGAHAVGTDDRGGLAAGVGPGDDTGVDAARSSGGEVEHQLPHKPRGQKTKARDLSHSRHTSE